MAMAILASDAPFCPARGVNAMAMALEVRCPHGNVSTETWVRPVDHAQDRTIALPDMVRESLTRARRPAVQGIQGVGKVRR
jgi:hypothetical protein